MARNKEERKFTDSGQAMVLFSFMIVVLLLCCMCVVDVGMFLHKREMAQEAADAAALAGSQDLPDDPAAAQAAAISYLTANGMDPDDATITLSCTSNSQQICLTGDGRYDTIRVTPKINSPTFFGGALSIMGVNSCWVHGCDVSATAAGCRGACGPIGTGKADIMVIFDHTASMTSSDITNARNAIIQMFGDFDSTYQQVGLAVTPPVTAANHCDSIDHWSDTPKIWMPASLTNDFQTSPHVLDSSSPPVSTTNCLDHTDWSNGELVDYTMCPYSNGKSLCHTDMGSVIKAAADELNANGRPNVTHGIILLTDGNINVAPTTSTTGSNTDTNSTDTGWQNCSSNQAVNSNAGDNNGYQTSAGSGCSNDNNYAVDTDSGNTTATTCSDTGKDKHRYYNYGFNFPSGTGITNAITGIQVEARSKVDSASGSPQLCVELSWDGGTTWTTAKTSASLTTSEVAYTIPAAVNDTWGHSWNETQLNNSNFRIRITDVSSSTSRDFSLDSIRAKVYYTTTTVTTTTTYAFDNNLGPCDWVVSQANYAKSLGIEFYTIGFGLNSSEHCYDFNELVSSAYRNTNTPTLVQSLATDASHFYNEPKSSDLEPIFQVIGSQLTVGSRLVE